MMDAIIEFLKKNTVGFMATVGAGKPHVRPFGFAYYESGRFYFCTNSTKKVSAQLKESGYAEYAVSASDYSLNLRVSGRVAFDGSMESKKKVMAAMPAVREIYRSADNPIFEVFYMENGEAELTPFPPSADKPGIRAKF